MKVAIVGSRECGDIPKRRSEVRAVLSGLTDGDPGSVEVISGGAIGIDHIAERIACEDGYRLTVFRAAWDRFGKRAGFLRNQQIVDAADIIHAWWDGSSRGTADTIRRARKAGKQVVIHEI